MSRSARHTLAFVCCLLAMPAAELLLPGITAQTPQDALMAGAVLGLAHVFLRPVLRILSLPIGCLTLGLFGFGIDTALIYLCAYFVPGFSVTSVISAFLASFLTNAMCVAVGGRH